MLKVTISLEATCDLEKEYIEKYDLAIVDMLFEVGGQTYNTKDDDVITSRLYEQMMQKKKTCTSQINDFTYREHFEKLLANNQPIIHLALTRGLSGTIETAIRVANELNEKNKNKIYVIDSFCGCAGQGLLGILAREYSQSCQNVEELIDYIENIKHKMRHYYTVDTLSFLASGGRIDSKVAFFGNLLNIKPVMELSRVGKLELMHKVISRKKSISALANLTIANYDEAYSYSIILHANCLKDALALKEKIEMANSNIKPIIGNLGPVIGSHSGPGTLAVFFVGKENR